MLEVGLLVAVEHAGIEVGNGVKSTRVMFHVGLPVVIFVLYLDKSVAVILHVGKIVCEILLLGRQVDGGAAGKAAITPSCIE
jgi:hypothetical protein